MSAWLVALNDAWDELAQAAPVARQYRSKLISTNVPLDILAAMRATDNAPCLMLQTTPSPDALFELGGMRLSTVPDTSGTFLVLSLEDGNRRDLFTTICSDVIEAAVHAGQGSALGHFLARLDAWRQFLRDRRSGLSREETVGLLGELVILERVLLADCSVQSSWEAPDDGLHDFQSNGHALEIKTSLGPSSNLRISSLDQLEPSGLRRLDLLHVRLIEAPDGRTIGDLITSITATLVDDVARRSFENALLRRGLMPDDDAARSGPRVQLRAIEGYSASETFPRLVRTDVPAAITDANYTLDLRSLAPFSVDYAGVLEAFIQGAST
jgi:hypothetical protein